MSGLIRSRSKTTDPLHSQVAWFERINPLKPEPELRLSFSFLPAIIQSILIDVARKLQALVNRQDSKDDE